MTLATDFSHFFVAGHARRLKCALLTQGPLVSKTSAPTHDFPALIRFMLSILASVLVLLALILVSGCGEQQAQPLPRIIFKFKEGYKISLKGDVFVLNDVSGRQQGEHEGRSGDRAQSVDELMRLNQLLKDPVVLHVAPLFSRDTDGLATQPRDGERDLRLYYSIVLQQDATKQLIERLIRQIAALGIVETETVYEAVIGEDAGMDEPKP